MSSNPNLIKVDFNSFVKMTQLHVNCLYRTLNKVNEKVDYSVGHNQQQTMIQFVKINNEMAEIQKECEHQFEILKQSLTAKN